MYRHPITKSEKQFWAEKKVGAFLMLASSATYRRASIQLGMGVSTVL